MMNPLPVGDDGEPPKGRGCVRRIISVPVLFTAYGVVGSLLLAFGKYYRIEYDSGLAQGVYHLSYPLWGFPFWLLQEIGFAWGAAMKFRYQLVGGLSLCVALDLVIAAVRLSMNSQRGPTRCRTPYQGSMDEGGR